MAPKPSRTARCPDFPLPSLLDFGEIGRPCVTAAASFAPIVEFLEEEASATVVGGSKLLLEFLLQQREYAASIGVGVRLGVAFRDMDVCVIPTAIVASRVGFVHPQMPVASGAGEATDVV